MLGKRGTQKELKKAWPPVWLQGVNAVICCVSSDEKPVDMQCWNNET